MSHHYLSVTYSKTAEYFINTRKNVFGRQFTTNMRVIVSKRVSVKNVFQDSEQQAKYLL